MTDQDQIYADLRAEGDELAAILAPLPADEWPRPTPAEGWTIAHQVSHLAWTDGLATLAVSDPQGFDRQVQGASGDLLGYIEAGAAEGVGEDPAELFARWQRGRAALLEALAAVPAGTKVRWVGPPMAGPSMATARIMETWAHGQDVADALGVHRPETARLRHVAHLGVRARDFAFRLRDLDPPAEEFRVELTGPDGETWAWGPSGATQRVTGPGLDFCLLVTRRRHRDDLDLAAEGADAQRWLEVAQAFVGPPGSDPVPAGRAG